MAPSPAAGRGGTAEPQTPTKAGKKLESQSTSKLTGSGRKPPKLGSSKATPKKAQDSTNTDSPSLPPRPKQQDVSDKGKEAEEEAGDQIQMKDDDQSDAASGKVGKGTEADTSVADTDELEQADPNPVDDDDDDTVPGAKDTVDKAAKDEGTEEEPDTETGEPEETPADETEDAAEEAEDEKSGSGALGGLKSAASGVSKGAKGAAGRVGQAAQTAQSAGGKLAKGDVQGAGKDTTDGAQDTATGAADDAQEAGDDTVGAAKEAGEGAADDAEDAAQGDVPDAGEAADDVKDTAGEAAEGAQDTADDAQATAGETAEGVKDQAEETAEGAQDQVGDVKDQAEETAEGAQDQVGDVKDQAEETAEGAQDQVGDVKDQTEEAAEGDPDTADADGLKDQAEETAEGAQDAAGEAAEGATDDLPVDLSVLKGLKVEESGDVLDKEGNPIGKLEEGDAADLEGYEIADNGEILDEDGDVVGRANVLPEKAQELADQATDQVDGAKDDAEGAVDEAGEEVDGVKDEAEEGAPEVETYLPDISTLKGLEVQENGDIQDKEGNVLGKISEGDPADLVGMALNEEGEILDEDGDVVGRAEVLPQEVQKEAEPQLPGLDALEGLEVGEDGAIKDADGNKLGQITEGDPADLAGMKLNEQGEILDEDGDVIGRAEVVPEAVDVLGEGEGLPDAVQEAIDKVDDLQEQLKPTLDIIEGKKLNKKGKIIDDEGEILAELVEGDPKACAGKIPNENGEILDDEGNVIGKVEVVQGEAADEAMKELHPELVEELEQAEQAAEEAKEDAEGAADEAKDAADEAKDAAEEAVDAAKPDFSQIEGLKVNKKGEVINEDGEPIAKLSEGYDLEKVRGKKINANGEIVDDEGNVIGKVEFLQEAIDEGLVEMEEPEVDQADTSILEGLKVNKKGQVLDEEGEIIAELSEGELTECAGKKLNDKGEVLDKEGNVIGKVEMKAQEAEEEAAEEDDGLPPLSILDGLTVNKQGKIVNAQGDIVGELVEGDAKKLWKSKIQCDDQGQFWDTKGHVIGRAKTLPQEEKEEEAEFAGLDGLKVVADGWVEDENDNRVGRVVEGDPKRLVGRAVDEDGDILDRRGNAVGHAERYEEPEVEQEEEQVIDLSSLKGLTCNKQGNVVGPEGVPIGRLVEGNPKELAGRKIDGEGQIWNDSGEVVGRCELIPMNEREAKPEGPFAGLENPHVTKEGYVEDEGGNVVGKVVEGNVKQLVGRPVDEDGDINDRYGNVKGRAEPYEIPEEEVVPDDLSSLAGKTVNKQGKVVDEHGTIFGEVVEGEVKRLIGCKVDGEGQIWSADGKVIGKAGLISGGDDGRAEGPFSNFEQTVVQKDGTVTDSAGQIVGRVTEGDLQKLIGRKVDDDGDIEDKNGNVIGHAERWSPEEKEREINLMSGLRVNKEGEVRDKNGDVIGRLTDGNLTACVGKEINDNGYVVDQDGNKLGEVTLLGNIVEEEDGPSEEELKEMEEREVAKKIGNIVNQTLEKMEPICKQITDLVEKADRTPKEELDEEKLVNDVKPLIEEGGRILGECNGAIRGLDPDGHVAAQAKARAASGEASPEEHRVAEGLKELTSQVVKTIDNAKKRISDMPHAKKKLNPLWGLLTEPLFQIIAAVGLLLSGVLGLVGKLLNGLGLGGLVNGILGGLGVDKLLGGLGLGSIGESLGLGGGKKK